MPARHPCPEGERYCKDCGRCRPLSVFYRPDSSYCIEHQRKRADAHRRTAAPDSKTREARRRADRAYAQRHRNDPDYIARRQKAHKAFRERHPERRSLGYRSWAERNPEKRRQSQDAWRQRQSLRLRRRPPADGLDTIRRQIAERDHDIEKDE